MVILFVATWNAHKAQEIRGILGGRFQCLTLNNFPNAPRTIEDASTFAGNATKKSVEFACWLARRSNSDFGAGGMEPYVLADDSGLEVDALNGAPGVHSARFAALGEGTPGASHAVGSMDNAADTANNAKLLRLLQDVPLEKRTARFRCLLALTPVLPEAAKGASPVCDANASELQTELFEGVCEGHIGLAPQGQGGFGYDPLFVPDGYEQSFAALDKDVKNRLSHRARALARLRDRLLK